VLDRRRRRIAIGRYCYVWIRGSVLNFCVNAAAAHCWRDYGLFHLSSGVNRMGWSGYGGYGYEFGVHSE
jgi:hypothetical protein